MTHQGSGRSGIGGNVVARLDAGKEDFECIS